MKIVTKLAVATLLALSTLTPALAGEQGARADRNMSAATARHHMQDTHRLSGRALNGANAFASDPAPATGPDFSILSQH